MYERGLISASLCEGYDDFFLGIKRDDCPYPNTNELVIGCVNPVTCKMKRQDWLMGWDHAKNEIIEDKEDS